MWYTFSAISGEGHQNLSIKDTLIVIERYPGHRGLIVWKAGPGTECSCPLNGERCLPDSGVHKGRFHICDYVH
jgi:hypothetical protein